MDDFGLLVGRFLTTLPTLSNEQVSTLQLDASGRLIIAGRYAVDTASAASDPMILIGGQRRDADTTIATADGQYAPFQLDDEGFLKVTAKVSVEASDAEYVHGAAFTSGTDVGLLVLTTKQETLGADANVADGDFGSFKVNALGELYVHDTSVLAKLTDIETILNGTIDVNVAPPGTEAYTVSDALAAAGDGLITITAAATPWVTVASIAVGAGTTAYIYGWQFACDQNCQARIITDDTTDEIVYKTDINSSAQPGVQEHFANDGRIEIVGAEDLELRIEMKKRSATGGNANGTGSVHVRLV